MRNILNALLPDAERNLYNEYKLARQVVDEMMVTRNYSGVLEQIMAMAKPIDTFFGEVMVMAEDVKVRGNRLALLKAITGLIVNVVDVSKIVEL